MPKATSKTFKKKKYNARFPPARIKKIMQTDEEVGKVAAAVPVIISRALEMFIESLILKTAKTTQAKNAKTLSTSHIKQTIHGEKQFDFLRDLVKNVPDHQTEENNGDALHESESLVKRGRGRPRKSSDAPKPGRKIKSGQAKTSSDTSEEEEDYDLEDDEDTETDEEGPKTSANIPVASADRLLPAQTMGAASNGAGVYQPGFSGAPAMSFPPPPPPPPPPHERSSFIQCQPFLPPSQTFVSALPTIAHPPTHFMPQYPVAIPQHLPVNLSNPSRPSAVGVKEDDDYDS